MQAGTVIMDFSEWGDLLPAGYLVTRTRGCFHLSDWEDTPRCAGPELYYQQYWPGKPNNDQNLLEEILHDSNYDSSTPGCLAPMGRS